MTWIITFILGALVGSFLNCVIYRLEKKEGFVKGRSYCPHCKNTIEPRDLVPIISFIMLKGRCRSCQGKISLQYPLTEAIIGVIFVIILLFQQDRVIFGIFGILETAYLLLMFCLMAIIFIYDLKHYLIPDEAIFFAIGTTVAWHLISVAAGAATLLDILPFVFSGIGASGFFLAIFLFSKGTWMGFGDVKLTLFMGLFLGYPGIVVALFSSFMSGAIIGSVMVLLKKKEVKSEIPFAPFLILGTVASFFWGDAMLGWYLNFFSINALIF